MTPIRLDKYISDALIISRKDAAAAIRRGRALINGSAAKPETKINPETDEVVFDGKKISYSPHIYIMLNKPRGLVCAASDARDKTVLSLFDKAYADKGLFSCGRLDKDTVGLLIMTTDGALSHRLLSPKHHAQKVYLVKTDRKFTEDDVSLMRGGVMMDGKKTKPALLEILPEKTSALITLTEGKYHEIKRLCYCCGQKEVLYLKRIKFAGLSLDEELAEGEWRNLTDEEIQLLKSV